MSVLRLSRPGYETQLIPCDDGAVGRITASRRGIKGGSGTVVYGAHVTGEGQRSRDLRLQREAAARARAS